MGIPKQALQILGPTHTVDIPIALANIRHLALPNGTCTLSESAQANSYLLANTLTSMAKSQKPFGAVSQWPEYTSSIDTVGLTFMDESRAGFINFTRCQLWDRIAQIQLQAAEAGNLGGSNETIASGNSSTNTTSPSSPTMLSNAHDSDQVQIFMVSIILCIIIAYVNLA